MPVIHEQLCKFRTKQALKTTTVTIFYATTLQIKRHLRFTNMIFSEYLQRVIIFFCFLILFFSSSVSGQSPSQPALSLNLAPRYRNGTNTIQTMLQDLDGDGNLDVAGVNGFQDNPAPTITIRFGTGSGDFGAPLVIPTILIGHTISAGDLNQDGMPDLVIAGWYQNGIAVLLNQGHRQFSAPVFTIPTILPSPNGVSGEFFELSIADFDGDGKNDVVTLQGQINQRLRFFHYNENSTLTEFATLAQIIHETSYERKMAVGDLNGDNRPDIVFAGGWPGPRYLSFVFGQPTGGNLSMTYGFEVEDKAAGITINDLDNDGDNDLAIAFNDTSTPIRHSVQAFLNNGSGNFIATPKIFLEYPFTPYGITSGDFNNDGKRDLAALLGAFVMVVNGRGDGTFGGEKFYVTSGSDYIFTGDLNGDSKPDLLTASALATATNQPELYGSPNTFTVLFNDNFQGFKAPPVTLWGPSFIDAADFNNDGFTDLVSSWETIFNNTSNIDLMLNDRVSGFLPEQSYPSPAGLQRMKVGDFNGDGNRDAVSAHAYGAPQLSAYLGNGTGTLSAPINTPASESLSNIIVGDFNSDGKDDCFVVDYGGRAYSMLSNGNGTFSTVSDSPIIFPSRLVELRKGDFNNDRKIDLISSINSEVKLWLGDGTGRFSQSPVVLPYLEPIVPGDFNADGNLDLAGMSGFNITAILGNGSGGFGPSFSRRLEGTYGPYSAESIVAADFDLDGFDDLALSMSDNELGNLIILPSSGTANAWKQPIFYGAIPARTLIAEDFNADRKPDLGYLGWTTRGVIYNTTSRTKSAVFDFDGDGKTDISIYRPGPGEWWLNRSSTSATFAAQFGTSSDKPTPADFTGDGKTDVAFFRPVSGEWFILRSEDSSFFSFPFGTSGDVPIIGDFDSDGKADPGVFRPSSNEWFISKSSGGTIITTFGASGDVPVVADYDGDGKADIAIYRPSVGQWWISRSSNGSVIAAAFGSSTDKPVQGDYSGDGKADIAFWRPSTGEWFILRSEDGSYYSVPFGTSGDLPTPGDYDGDGKFDTAVFRSSGSTWFINRTTSGLLITNFGAASDLPVPNVFVP